MSALLLPLLDWPHHRRPARARHPDAILLDAAALQLTAAAVLEVELH